MAQNKVFQKAQRGEYMDVTDAAKIARELLKKAFPKTKFRVRSSKYAGGSSLNISYTDGPIAKMVSDIVAPLEGKGFDGMVDYAYYKDTWILPDGSIERAGTDGSDCTGGYHEAAAWEPSNPEAVKVSFGCYVFVERGYTEAALERTLQSYAAKWGDELAEAIEAGTVFVKDGYIQGANAIRCGSQWGSDLLWQHRGRRMMADV
jgi:hypothetical protein